MINARILIVAIAAACGWLGLSPALAQIDRLPRGPESAPGFVPASGWMTPFPSTPAWPIYPMGATADQIMEQVQRETNERMGFRPPPTQEEIQRKSAWDAQRFDRTATLYRELQQDLRETSAHGSGSNEERSVDCRERLGFSRSDSVTSPQRAMFLRSMNRLEWMLKGKIPLNLSDAVFTMEQPVLGNNTDHKSFDQMVGKLASMVKQNVARSGKSTHDADALHEGIQRLFKDTVVDRETGRTFYPLRYDLEDIWGDMDPAKLLVTKLLKTGEGQCRSMPLLYLLLAERLGIEAYWAFSPNHSYVKYRNKTGRFENFETTIGMKSSDDWLTRSGYFKSEATRNRIYLDTVGTKRAVAHLLSELVQSYEQWLGTNEELAEHCLRTTLHYYPTDIHAWLQLRNLRVKSLQLAGCSGGYTTRSELERNPELAKKMKDIEKLDALVDGLGFSEMPPDAYSAWLESLEREKKRRAEEQLGKPILPASPKR